MKTQTITIPLFSMLIGLASFGSCVNDPTREKPGNTGKQKPNVLLISIDDLNDWVGFLEGHPDTRTPNIDRLAERGVAFTNAHVPAPACGPCRTALLSGISPNRTGSYENPDIQYPNPKRDYTPALKDAVNVFEHFRNQGFTTLMGGKIFHELGPGNDPDDLYREMVDVYGGFFQGQNFTLWSSDYPFPFEGVKGWTVKYNHWGPLDDSQADSLSDGQVVQWAREQLKKEFDKPFFMGVGFYRPHVPLTAPQRFFDMFDPDEIALAPLNERDYEDLPRMGREVAFASFIEYEGGTYNVIKSKGMEREKTRAYLACVAYVDWCVGEVLRALEESPYADNTIVVLFSDHGWGMRERFHWAKWGLWERITRVPMIIAGPGTGKPGREVKAGVSLIDLYPTLVDMCGLDKPTQVLDGQSLVPLIRNPDIKWEKPALTTLGPNNHSLRNERYRYIRWSDGSEELYDHQQDPDEWYNLAEKPGMENIKKKMGKWLPEVNVPSVRSSFPVVDRLELEVPKRYLLWSTQPHIAGQQITVKALVEPQASGGVILKMGGQFAGISVYIKDGYLHMAVMDVPAPLTPYTLVPETIILRASDPMPAGKSSIQAQLKTDGSMILTVNGKMAATGKARGPLSVYPFGELTTGNDAALMKNPAIGDYNQQNSAFRGKLENLVIEFND